jgi:hypothetical protein
MIKTNCYRHDLFRDKYSILCNVSINVWRVLGCPGLIRVNEFLNGSIN